MKACPIMATERVGRLSVIWVALGTRSGAVPRPAPRRPRGRAEPATVLAHRAEWCGSGLEGVVDVLVDVLLGHDRGVELDGARDLDLDQVPERDRKSTRLNSSH